MSLFSDFTRQISKAGYWKTDETVIAGVSGGLDSIVLLDMLIRLPQELRPAVHVAHINHQLRKESDEEETFIKQLCADYNVPCSVDVWDSSLHPGSGIEQAARERRYDFFKRIAETYNSAVILTAHHKNDQVETVLMRLVRGNSLDELTGISSKRAESGLTLVRPLLPYGKDTLLDYAKEQGLIWHEDQSNLSADYTRNRFRHRIMPVLREENDKVDEHIVTFSKEVSEVLSLLEPVIDEKIECTMVISEDDILIDRTAFLELTPPLQKRVLKQAVKKWAVNEAFPLKRVHSKLLMDWLKTSSSNSAMDLPNGLSAVREYNECRITFKNDSQTIQLNKLNSRQQLDLLPDQWLPLTDKERIGLLTLESFKSLKNKEAYQAIYLDLKDEQLPLKIRHRKNGDRMSLKGMQGSRKLKDIFIDQKTPLKKRDEARVITDNTGEILWLVGHKESALSLDPITDTISYVLVYNNN